MFIELTDSYDGRNFCLNIDAIKTVRDNGRYTIVTTVNTQYSVYESYSEIIKRLNSESKII